MRLWPKRDTRLPDTAQARLLAKWDDDVRDYMLRTGRDPRREAALALLSDSRHLPRSVRRRCEDALR